jgi:hypothetical protein
MVFVFVRRFNDISICITKHTGCTSPKNVQRNCPSRLHELTSAIHYVGAIVMQKESPVVLCTNLQINSNRAFFETPFLLGFNFF